MQNRHTNAVWALWVFWLLGLASFAVAERQELTLANGDRYDGEVIDGILEESVATRGRMASAMKATFPQASGKGLDR